MLSDKELLHPDHLYRLPVPPDWPQVDWKVRRGKWRGPLVGYARQADDGQVQAASRAAFAALRGGGGGKQPGEDAVKQALDAMCVIYVSAAAAGSTCSCTVARSLRSRA